MAIDPKKWTLKTQEAVNAAMGLAKERSNAEVGPDHVVAEFRKFERRPTDRAAKVERPFRAPATDEHLPDAPAGEIEGIPRAAAVGQDLPPAPVVEEEVLVEHFGALVVVGHGVRLEALGWSDQAGGWCGGRWLSESIP